MDARAATANPLLSTQKASDLQVVLHPIVLLCISDYIARHTLRKRHGPIVGALLGQQQGRELTIEHAYEVQMTASDSAIGGYVLDQDKFAEKLDLMRMVHTDRRLDLVGWYTLMPTAGPTAAIPPVHSVILQKFNESAVLLGFHPAQLLADVAGSKLPITLYESTYEVEESAPGPVWVDEGEDSNMNEGEPQLKIRFRELQYAIEVGDVEMVAIECVATSGMNATAREAAQQQKQQQQQQQHQSASSSSSSSRLEDVRDQKRTSEWVAKSVDAPAATSEESTAGPQLSTEEEEAIATLTRRANAIKMLQARVDLLVAYLESLPKDDGEEITMTDAGGPTPSPVILRQIQALVSRLGLVVPSDVQSFEREILRERTDVRLLSIVESSLEAISVASKAGRKYAAIETARRSRVASLAAQPHAAGSRLDKYGMEVGRVVGDMLM